MVWVCVGDDTTDEGTDETAEDGVTSSRGLDDGAAVLVDVTGDDVVAGDDVAGDDVTDAEVSVDVDGVGDDASDDDVSDDDVVVSAGVDELVPDGVLVGDVLVGADVSDVLDVLVCVSGTSGSTTGGALGGTVALGSRFSTLTDNCCN